MTGPTLTASSFFISAAIPVADGGAIDPAHIRGLAVTADMGGIDFLTMQQPGDSLIAASWLITATRRVGLVSAVSATYAQPFHTARSLSAMDLLSRGRMGWMPEAAQHHDLMPYFGNLPPLPLTSALDKAMEFVTATEALWDSWDADALIIDKASARYLDNSKIRRVDYRGAYFQVMGPLNSARPTQGYPVLVVDDSDPLFDSLCDRADVLLITAATPADAKLRSEALKSRRTQRILVKIAGEGPAADLVAGWRASGSCDGCHILTGATDRAAMILQGLMPELQNRGLLNERGATETLRARLGLPLPVNPYSTAGTHGGA
jgi:hypothetical protein